MADGKLLLIVGPTATGKSAIAAGLAAEVNGEIVSADSMQVYRGMDIGTAKPDRALLELVPHHLLSFVDPASEFSVAQFQQRARAVIAEMHTRGALPVVVGGSGLYVRAVIDPLDFPAGSPDSALRRELTDLEAADPKALIDKLQAIDPHGAANIDLQNTRRVVRAIESALAGETYADRLRRWRRHEALYDVLIVGLRIDRQRLKTLIDLRVDEMVEAGLEDEVKRLTTGGHGLSSTAAQALGYKEFIDFFEGRATRDEAIDLIKRRTRQFAKRQLTWFRADPRIVWLNVDDRTLGDVVAEIVALVRGKGFIVS